MNRTHGHTWFARAAARAALLALVCIAAGAVAFAVEQTGELKGTVRDSKGKPLPGATAALSGVNLQGTRGAVSDASGEFVFRVLPPGPYTLRLTLEGYQTTEIDNVVINVGRTTAVPVDLPAGKLTENVKVTASAPLVDTVRTQTQDNYTPEYLQKVQIGSGGRDYLSVISNSAGTGPGDGANPTVRGSTIGQNVYLIDGVDSTDPVTETFGSNFIYDAIQEVQFQTGGFEAEFGRSAGGIINVVTKSGGNAFSGSLDGRYRNENFIEKGDHFDPHDLTIKHEIFEGTLGGPIVKDKLWFFTAGSYVRSDFNSGLSPTTFEFNGRYYLGKLTYQLSPNHKLIAQITGDPATIDNADASALVAREATSKQTQGSRFATVQWLGTISSSFLLQAQAAYYKSRLDFEPQRGDFHTIGWVDFLSGAQTRNSIDAQFSERFLNQANATATWNVPRLFGDHTFKFGIDVQDRKFQFDDFAPGGEYDQVAPDAGGTTVPLLYNVINPAGRLTNDGIVTGSFAQDNWRVHPNLTLNLGVRYETFAYNSDRGHRVLSSHIVEPRIGLSWDATGDAKNVFKAYGGTFADPSLLALPRVVNSRANSTDLYINETIGGYLLGGGPTPVDFNGDGTIETRGFYGTFGGAGGSRFDHSGRLQMTNVAEFSTSYERQLSPLSSVGLTLVRRKTHDIIEDECDASVAGGCDPNAPLYIIRNIPELVRKYYGAELRFRTKYKKLSLWSSYTWSKSKGNIGYTQSLGSDWDFPNLRTNRYGYLSDDARHVVRLNGYYELPLRFEIGFGGTYNSGYPFTLVRSAFPYGLEFAQRRGSERFPDFYQVDVELRKGIPIGGSDLQLILSVLNLLNTETVTAVNTNVSANGQAIGYQTPRRVEVGAHYRF